MKKNNKQYMKVPENYFQELSLNIVNKIESIDESNNKVRESNTKKLKIRFLTSIGITAAVVFITFLALPSDFFSTQSQIANQTNDLIVTQGDYYLFIEEMQDDTISDEYWTSMIE